MQRVFRQNLSGGLIGPDLRYRSDIEHYKKANIEQKNFLPTIYGGLRRRPPAGVLASLSTSITAARFFEFVYSADTKYIVVLERIDNDPAADTTQFEIYNTSGALIDTVACTGQFEYAAADFFQIQVKQLNDVMFIVHNDYPVARLERLSASSFQLVEWELTGGPFMDWNLDESAWISSNPDVYDGAATYAQGDVVYKAGTQKVISTAEYVYWRTVEYEGDTRDFYLLRLDTTTSLFDVNDTVYIEGMPALINGFKTVVANPSSTVYDFNIGTYSDDGGSTFQNKPDLTGYPTGSSYVRDATGENDFYVSKTDGNTGNALPAGSTTENTYWRQTAQFNELTLQTNQEALFGTVGRLVLLELDKATVFEGSSSTTGYETEPYAYPGGAVTLRTVGCVWDGQVDLEQSVDGGTVWRSIGSIYGINGNNNGEITRDIFDPRTILRVKVVSYTPGGLDVPTSGTDVRWELEFPAGSYFIGKITAISGDYECTVKGQTSLIRPFQTTNYKLGSFSGITGYPGTVTIHEERLMLGGTTTEPFKIWGSAVNQWANFLEASLATSPVTFQANADRSTRMSWMVSKHELVFGTDFNEYTAGQRDSDNVISIEEPPRVLAQSSHTGKQMPAALIDDAIVFVQNDGKTVRAMRFSAEMWGYNGEDLTIFNPSITGSGVKQMAVQKAPFNVLWCVTDDSNLISFTMDSNSNINGWAEYYFPANASDTTGDDVLTVAVLPTAAEDEVFILVDRSGTPKLYKLDFTATTYLDDGTVPFYSTVKPTYFVQDNGFIEDRKFSMKRIMVYLKESQGGEVSADDGTNYRDIPYGGSSALFTGKKQITVNSGFTETAEIIVRTNGQKAFNILAIGAEITQQSTEGA
jgi:hypothetical protein